MNNLATIATVDNQPNRSKIMTTSERAYLFVTPFVEKFILKLKLFMTGSNCNSIDFTD